MTTAKARTFFVAAVLSLLAMLLATAPVSALYPPDGAMPTGVPGGYMNPDDGMCVVGVAAAGTMLVDWNVTNARDCAAYTTGLATLTAADITSTSTCPTQPAGGAPYTTNCSVKANCSKSDGSLTWSDALLKCFDTSACTIAGANPGDGFAHVGTNDGYKHAVTFSLCSNLTGGVSRVDLDSTDAMCVSKGGTVKYTTGNCIAYGWVYRNRKADGPPQTLPVSGTGVGTTDGVQSTDGLGFCYTAIRMTGGTYTVPVLPAAATSCPSWHNSPGVCIGGTNNGTGCTANSTCTGGGTCNLGNFGAGLEWPPCGSSTTGCQTPASYDAGLGWSWDAANSRCVYAFGVNGPLNGNVITAAGVKTPAGSASGDLTLITNQGDCLAAGYSWDNWLPFPTTVGGGYRTSADLGDYAGMPAGAKIVKFDAITPVDDGGGEFFSGTGFTCLKCHSDQSRAYQERDKPGFVKTRHQKAGDDLSKPFAGYFTAGSSSWGLQGVQCAMCHSTAKPARDDLIQVVPAGVVGPPVAGAPKSATGHNQTEYGAHLLDICYTCHGSAANPTTTNPASVIPVSAGDFALTSNLPGPATSLLSTPPLTAGLAPIVNQFLNSPHALYTGTSLKVDVGNKNNYGSTFEGYVCRSAAGNFNRTSATPAACTAAGLTAYTVPGFGYTCYYNAAQCAAAAVPAPNANYGWHTTFDPNAYPWAVGPETGSTTKTTIGGVCSGLGIGNIQTTVYRNGVAEKIPNLDSTTNTACTNNGDGSATSGAAGYWVLDGESSPGGTPADTAQGNCMTCHDVHWALADPSPEAEPFRRECTTCHSHPVGEASASGAPQINIGLIKHAGGTGTPLQDVATDPNSACEKCHMPKSGGATSSPMHLWRINTSAAYQTMGTTEANTAADGTYADAAWVDLDHACGQCHGGGVQTTTTGTIASGSTALAVASATGFTPGQAVLVSGAGVSGTNLKSTVASVAALTVTLADSAAASVTNVAVAVHNPTTPEAGYLTKAQLSGYAEGIHNASLQGVNFGYALDPANTLRVKLFASASCTGGCDAYTWDCGLGGTLGPLPPAATPGVNAVCTYTTAGAKHITLTVTDSGATGTATKTVTVAEPDRPPYFGDGISDCGVGDGETVDTNNWKVSIADNSQDDNGVSVVTVNWGDGSLLATGGQSTMFGPHTYRGPGTYNVVHKAIDSIGQQVACTNQVTLSYFMITGTVTKGNVTYSSGNCNLPCTSQPICEAPAGANGCGGSWNFALAQCEKPAGTAYPTQSTPTATSAACLAAPSAKVTVKQGTTVVRTVYTAANGSYMVGSLKPGTYALNVAKNGYNSPSDLMVTVGGSKTGQDMVLTVP